MEYKRRHSLLPYGFVASRRLRYTCALSPYERYRRFWRSRYRCTYRAYRRDLRTAIPDFSTRVRSAIPDFSTTAASSGCAYGLHPTMAQRGVCDF